MKKYDIILFDADGTLFDFSKCEREAFKEALLSFGVTASEEMIFSYHEINDSLWKALERKEIERSVLVYKRFELFFKKYSIKADALAMAQAYVSCLGEKSYLFEGAIELLDSLYGRVKMYIVTNGIERVQKRRFELSGVERYFEDIFISEAVGANKPDARYFEYVEAHIDGFDKSRALVIGDSLSSDIAGGVGYGIDTCWYAPSGEESSLPTYTARSFDEISGLILGGEKDA